MRRLRRTDAHRRGQTLVEFALIAPIFILILVGLFDAGRAVYAWSTINNAAHTAARLAIVDQNVGDVTQAAVDSAVGTNVDAGDVSVRWLSAQYTNVAPCNTTPRAGCTVEVEVRYQFVAATPLIGNLMGVINLEGLARQPIERGFASP